MRVILRSMVSHLCEKILWRERFDEIEDSINEKYTVSLKNFWGTGYKCTQKTQNVTYSKNKNSIKVKKAFYFDGNTVELKKRKKTYHIRMIPNKADSINYWELGFRP